MVNCLNVSAIVLAFLGIGFLIVSVATDYWRSFTTTILYKTKYSQGLFRQCASANSQTACSKLMKEISDYPAKLAAVVAMMLLAILFQGISMIVATVATMMKKKLNACIAILQFLAAGAGAAGLAIYAKYYDIGAFKLDWSYALGWVGTGFIGIGLVVLFVIMMR